MQLPTAFFFSERTTVLWRAKARMCRVQPGDLFINDKKPIQYTKRSLEVPKPFLSSGRILFLLLGMPDEAEIAHMELAKIAKEGGNLKAASASAFRALRTTNINSDIINAANNRIRSHSPC
eukprot:gb/GEZJ01005319.1/.p1 GENE.gb/GEZJ01005319.1/~~gb/GEZJ01005319.1/.p1  ORF type:complete len:121 (-),score=13.00 gb/GEZJ01005319.1/:712-1074(-)